MNAGKRRPRHGRPKASEAPAVELHADDLALFSDLARVRLLSSDQICAIFPPRRRRDTPYSPTYNPNQPRLDRLRQLYDTRYLDRVGHRGRHIYNPDSGRYGGSERLVYALGTRGAAALHARDPRQHVPDYDNDLRELFIDHELEVSNVFTTLRVAERHELIRQLAFWHCGQAITDSFWTDAGGRAVEPPAKDEPHDYRYHKVRPDAYFCLAMPSSASGGQELGRFYFLEADRSQMSHRAMRAKYAAYEAFFRLRRHTEKFRIKFFTVLTLTISPERRDELRQLAATLDREGAPTPLFWFCCQTDFSYHHPERFFGPIWHTPGSPASAGRALLG
jgi:hypothetical protein